jgi:hypothetical protein
VGPSLAQVLADLQQAHGLEAARSRAASTFSLSRPASDPLNSAADRTPPTATLLYGVVHQVFPYLGYYTVMPFGGGPAYPCRMARDSSTSPLTGRSLGGPQPLDRVWFVVSRLGNYGTIVSIDPSFISDRDPFIHEYLSQVSPTAPAADKLLMSHLAAKHHLSDYSNGGLMDATGLEKGYMFPTGVGYFADPWMAGLRADENCGIWAFFYDQLLRIHGHNLQIRSPGYEHEVLNDGGEILDIEGFSPYVWEGMGAFAGRIGEFQSVNAMQKDTPYVGAAEPIDNHQIPFRRLTNYRGYLGQGFRTILTIPPEDATGPFKSGGEQKTPAVFQEHLSLAGDYVMASARGAMFYHVPLLPAPVPQKRAEDKGGNDGNMSAQDKISGGPGGDNPTGAASGQAFFDDLAFRLGWSAQHPFHYRNKDWYTPAPNTMPAAIQVGKDQEPTSSTRVIDHRHSAEFAPTVSGYGLRPDGTFVVTGNGGEEMIIGNGRIILRAPEILLESGGDLIQFAGRDHVTRAYRSVESVAATGDQRIKAERQMELLGGNSGSGGVLIESRSASVEMDFSDTGTDAVFGGVIIKSTGSIAQIGSELYQRSQSGNIILDAAKGKADFIVNAASAHRFLSGQAVDQFNESSSNTFGENGALITGGIQTKGELVVSGGGTFRDSILVTSGHIATSNAKQLDGKVSVLSQQGLVAARSVVERAEVSLETANENEDDYREDTLESQYESGRIGNDTVLEEMGFSFRSTEQCQTEGFTLFESAWAMYARLAGLSSSTWTEPIVRTAGEDTYPFPGKDAWTSDESFVSRDPTLFQFPGGHMVAPGASYENAKYAAPQKKSLDGHYTKG